MLKYLSLFLLLINFHLGFTQNPNKVTDKEISKILFQSATSLMNLECDKSLNLAKEALRYAHLNENNELIAKSYNIIGLNFEEFSDFQKAIGFYNSGLKYEIIFDQYIESINNGEKNNNSINGGETLIEDKSSTGKIKNKTEKNENSVNYSKQEVEENARSTNNKRGGY